MLISGTIAKILLQKVAGHIAEQLLSSGWQAFGSSLIDPSNGRVMGHLQARDALGAAGDTANVLASLGLLGTPLAPVSLAYAAGKTGFAVFDTQRTVHRIESSLSNLSEQVVKSGQKLDSVGEGVSRLETNFKAGIGLQILDIGLNIANFEIVKKRLDDISDRVSSVDETLGDLKQEQLALAFTELRSLARALDEGWRLEGIGAENRWQEVAARALHIQDQFETRARLALAPAGAAYDSADALIDAVSFANGLRVSALSACNQSSAAIEAAADGTRTIEALSGRIGIADLIRPTIEALDHLAGSQEYTVVLAMATERARGVVGKIRQREANAATRASPLLSLDRRGVRPRDWLESVRAEDDTALIFMAEGD